MLCIHIFSATNPIDIKKYLNSEEANKIIRMTEVSSQVNAALLDNVKQYLTDPKKVNYTFKAKAYNTACMCTVQSESGYHISTGSLDFVYARSYITNPEQLGRCT